MFTVYGNMAMNAPKIRVPRVTVSWLFDTDTDSNSTVCLEPAVLFTQNMKIPLNYK